MTHGGASGARTDSAEELLRPDAWHELQAHRRSLVDRARPPRDQVQDGGRAARAQIPEPGDRVYLTLARPILLGRREFVIGEEDYAGSAPDVLTGGLWIGEGGKALGYSAVERAIMETTRQTIGRRNQPLWSSPRHLKARKRSPQ